jgi:hypothetical protein
MEGKENKNKDTRSKRRNGRTGEGKREKEYEKKEEGGNEKKNETMKEDE